MQRQDLGNLAMFPAAAEERSFTKAAATLNIPQSALSHTMRRLEKKLGLRLLARIMRSIGPTEACDRPIATLQPALNEIDNKLALLTELREHLAGTVRSTSSAYAARAVLWPVINRLAAENPDIDVEVSIESGLVDIVSGRFDAGVRLDRRASARPRSFVSAFPGPIPTTLPLDWWRNTVDRAPVGFTFRSKLGAAE